MERPKQQEHRLICSWPWERAIDGDANHRSDSKAGALMALRQAAPFPAIKKGLIDASSRQQAQVEELTRLGDKEEQK